MARGISYDSSYGSRGSDYYIKVWQSSTNEGVPMLSTSGHRIYAVTGRNKWVGSALSSLIAAQLILGVYMITTAAVNPSNFDLSFARKWTHIHP